VDTHREVELLGGGERHKKMENRLDHSSRSVKGEGEKVGTPLKYG